jgi:hypothetical protein
MREKNSTTMHGISENRMAAHVGVLFSEMSGRIFSLCKHTSKYTKKKYQRF